MAARGSASEKRRQPKSCNEPICAAISSGTDNKNTSSGSKRTGIGYEPAETPRLNFWHAEYASEKENLSKQIFIRIFLTEIIIEIDAVNGIVSHFSFNTCSYYGIYINKFRTLALFK